MNKKSRNNKKNSGFTLVELVVVMVIIAIMAAIIVPAFMSYMDKQKREQVIINAKDCLMVSQSLSQERYIYGKSIYASLDELNGEVGKSVNMDLTSANKTGAITYVKFGSKGKDLYTIHEFRYTENGITAVWKLEDAKWMYSDEADLDELTGLVKGGDGSSSGIVNNDIVIPDVEKTKKNPSQEGATNPENPSAPEETPTSEETPKQEEPTTEEKPTSQEQPTTSEEPTTTEEPTTEVVESDDYNKPLGDFVFVYKDADINTGITIEDSMYWPQKDIAKADIDNGVKSDHDTIPLKAGDVFMYNDSVYYVVQDRNLDYFTLAHNGADVICDMGWELVYRIDYEHVLTKEDFPPYPNWGENAKVIFVNNMAGKLYYSEEEKILYMAKSNQNNYFLPTKNNHVNFIILKDFNEE